MAVMRIIETSDGTSTPFDGQYVAEYDPFRTGTAPDGRPMTCHLVTTPERGKALNLPLGELLELWKRPNGLRADGEPNRPITAFSAEFS